VPKGKEIFEGDEILQKSHDLTMDFLKSFFKKTFLAIVNHSTCAKVFEFFNFAKHEKIMSD